MQPSRRRCGKNAWPMSGEKPHSSNENVTKLLVESERRKQLGRSVSKKLLVESELRGQLGRSIWMGLAMTRYV